jgi:hypothetical protein
MPIKINQATASKRRVPFTAADSANSPLTSASLWFFDVLGTKCDGTEVTVVSSDPIRGVTVPTAISQPNSPSTTEPGDLVIVFLWTNGTAGVPTHTLQSNWTQIISQSHDDGSTDGRLSVAYHNPSGGDAGTNLTGTQTLSPYSTSGGTDYAGVIVLKRGYWTVTGIQSAGTNDTGTTAPNPPSVTLNQKKMVIVASGWHMSSGATVNITAPSNYTEAWELAGSVGAEFSAAYRLFKTAVGTAEDPGSFTDDVTPDGSATVTIAITMTPATQADITERNLTTKPGFFYVQLAQSHVDTDPWLALHITNTGSTTDMVRRDIMVDIDPGATVTGTVNANVVSMDAGVVTAGAIAADAIGASEIAADAVAEIAAAVAAGIGTVDANVTEWDGTAVAPAGTGTKHVLLP